MTNEGALRLWPEGVQGFISAALTLPCSCQGKSDARQRKSCPQQHCKRCRARGGRYGSARPCRSPSSPARASSKAGRMPWKCRRRSAKSQTSLGAHVIYKTSFDKANRSSLSTARGAWPGCQPAGLRRNSRNVGLPVLTDVHLPEQCAEAATVGRCPADPGLPLAPDRSPGCRRARPAEAINVKKGQFLAPWDMKNVRRKSPESATPTCC